MELLKLQPEEDQREARLPPKRLVLPRLHSATPLIPRSSLDTHTSDETSRSPTELSYQRQTHPYGLRPMLHFPALVYPFLIVLNLVLRLIWSLRLFSVLNVKSHASLANFLLKTAELFRRWVWVFIRVEWEMIKKGREGHLKIRSDGDDAEYELIHSATTERTQ